MNLKQIKNDRGLTLQQIADMAGLPKRTVEEVLRRDTCSVKTAIKLADALGVTLDELCRDRTDKTE
ncbi:MAG: helix-turn-helix domain-containing protein [Ruminococcus sp.]|nr:helix-turn-helix domain-containing protein [Ruminococcus sp.]